MEGNHDEIVHNALSAITRKAGHRVFGELKTLYTRNFEDLGRFTQLAGVRDGFGIVYSASGLGAMIFANRKG